MLELRLKRMTPALHQQQRMSKEHMTAGGVAGRQGNHGNYVAGPCHKNICRVVPVPLVLAEKDIESESEKEEEKLV